MLTGHYPRYYKSRRQSFHVPIGDIIPKFVVGNNKVDRVINTIQHNKKIKMVDLKKVGNKYEIIKGKHRINALVYLNYKYVCAHVMNMNNICT